MTAHGGTGRQCVSCGEYYGSAVMFCPKDGTPTGPVREKVAKDSFLGRLLFQCIAGRTPFDGPNAVSILVQQLSATPPDLRSVGGGRDAPPALAALIAKNLDKDLLQRSGNARAFGADLSTCMFGKQADARITARLLGSERP